MSDTIDDYRFHKQAYAWAIFTLDGDTWMFHSAHWSKARAMEFASVCDARAMVRRIKFHLAPRAPRAL